MGPPGKPGRVEVVAQPASSQRAVAKPVAKIALVQTTDRTAGVQRALALLQPSPVRGKAVVIKPNFNSADPTPGSTHDDTLRALVHSLQDMGAARLTLAERSGGSQNTRRVMDAKDIPALARELDFQVVDLDEVGQEGWEHIKLHDGHWKDGFHFPRTYLESDAIVQTCCLKTHGYGGHFTMSLKNSVGMVDRVHHPYMRQLHNSMYQREMIAEINTAYTPDLVVLDGMQAFVTGGPFQGKLAKPGVIVAGSDRVAIDAVGVAILRLLGTTREVSEGPIFAQDQIARAVELDLGVGSPEQIEFVTGDEESAAYASTLTDILRAG
ncbi:MAG: hypothetical protein CL878_03005 [Dehalococcoidia bacterium]|nr:hypothetical protein [Dehalococcoidia bacterium]